MGEVGVTQSFWDWEVHEGIGGGNDGKGSGDVGRVSEISWEHRRVVGMEKALRVLGICGTEKAFRVLGVRESEATGRRGGNKRRAFLGEDEGIVEGRVEVRGEGGRAKRVLERGGGGRRQLQGVGWGGCGGWCR